MTTTTQHHDVRRTVSLIIVYALAPGALLHELAHWVVARRWADVSIHWGVPATVRMEWSPDTPPHAVLLGHWAPLSAGNGIWRLDTYSIGRETAGSGRRDTEADNTG